MKAQSLYIHIPFCLHKCLFCSFAIAVGAINHADEYLNRLEEEVKKYERVVLETVYIGGGTPSTLSLDQLNRLITLIRENFLLSEDCEITLEANPEGLDEVKAQGIKDLGINRISLGVQSLNDRYLNFLGRKHSAAQAKESYALLRTIGFTNINLDLMYAFPSQTVLELEEDVKALASLNSEHLSLYTLTIEPNSKFHVSAIKLDDEEKIAQGYLKVVEILGDYGFKQYEISNFSKEGFRSKHNQNYWLGKRYLGLGMGAHSFIENRRSWNKSKLQEYLNSSNPVEGFEDLNEETLIMEKVLFGLRMNDGIDPTLVPKSKKATIDHFIEEGFLEIQSNRLKATEKGQLVLDELSVRLI